MPAPKSIYCYVDVGLEWQEEKDACNLDLIMLCTLKRQLVNFPTLYTGHTTAFCRADRCKADGALSSVAIFKPSEGHWFVDDFVPGKCFR